MHCAIVPNCYFFQKKNKREKHSRFHQRYKKHWTAASWGLLIYRAIINLLIINAGDTYQQGKNNINIKNKITEKNEHITPCKMLRDPDKKTPKKMRCKNLLTFW